MANPNEVLAMALIGYEAERRRIDEAILAIRAQIGTGVGRPISPAEDGETPRPKRRISAAGRKRIAEAQKKRWAAFHKGEPDAPKKKLSAARRAALAANLAKARAAKAAKQAETA